MTDKTLQERLRDSYNKTANELEEEAADALDAQEARIKALEGAITPTEETLYQALTRLAIAISDEGLYWSPAMREAFTTGLNTQQSKDFPYTFIWRCRFCDNIKHSPNNTGNDITCCNVTGQASLYLEPPNDN